MILSLHYLRAVAAIMVLISHTRTKFHQVYGEANAYWWPTGGSAGIDIFFLISGFIITHVAWQNHRREGYIGTFVRKRLIRIVPVYWFWTTVALGVFLVAPATVNSSGGSTSVLCSYLFVPTDAKYLIQNGWSLSYELYFYGLFAVALCFPRRHAHAFIVLVLLSCFLFGLRVPLESALARFLTSALMVEFVVGMLFYWLYRRGWTLPPLVGVCACAWGLTEILLLDWLGNGHPLIYHGLPAAVTVFGALSAERWIRLHPLRWVSALGDASYSIYITHPFVLKAIAILLATDGLIRRVPYLAAGVGMLVASCGFGWLSYIVIERPILRWFGRRPGRGREGDTMVLAGPGGAAAGLSRNTMPR